MFSKKPDPTFQSPAPRNPAKLSASGGSTFSVIGAEVTVKGNISATADLHLDGNVEGDLACTSLVQGGSSHVEGAIEADTARLAGTVKGTVTVRELVILRSARIDGDVHYETLTIEQGATVNGRFAPDALKGSKSAEVLELKEEGDPILTLAG